MTWTHHPSPNSVTSWILFDVLSSVRKWSRTVVFLLGFWAWSRVSWARPWEKLYPRCLMWERLPRDAPCFKILDTLSLTYESHSFLLLRMTSVWFFFIAWNMELHSSAAFSSWKQRAHRTHITLAWIGSGPALRPLIPTGESLKNEWVTALKRQMKNLQEQSEVRGCEDGAEMAGQRGEQAFPRPHPGLPQQERRARTPQGQKAQVCGKCRKGT